jgi:hypothetical protein
LLVSGTLCVVGPACESDGLVPDDQLLAGGETDSGEFHDGENDESGESEDTDATEAELDCDFSEISGIWVRDDGLELPYLQTIVLGRRAEPGEVVGYTVIYTDSARLCAFDLTCTPSADRDSYRVAATLTDDEHALDCAEGFYEFYPDVVDRFQMSHSLNPSGTPEFASAEFVRTDGGTSEPGS